MKGLLLKDWYQIKSNMKTMYLTVLAVLVIWTLSASGASTFAMNYAAIFWASCRSPCWHMIIPAGGQSTA